MHTTPGPVRTAPTPRHARRWLALAAVGALLLGGCGTATDDPATANPATDPERGASPAEFPPGSLALVITDDGLAGVPVGTSTPAWTVAGAVAAPDGSAIFTVRPVPSPAGEGFEVLRIDPRTGEGEPVGRHVPGPAGIRVGAVAPGGDRVALIADGEAPDSTLVLDFDPSTGGLHAKPTFEGRLEPEAYSLDRRVVFAARIYAEHYHVHGLDLATGEQWPTQGPDKAVAPEDMYGSVVQAALSPDGSELATLYRNPEGSDHAAFVHLLSLETGTTVCIDLHEPFGTGGRGTEAITWRTDGTVAVGHRSADPAEAMTATFDPAEIWAEEPLPHYHAEYEPDPDAPALPDGVVDVPGFQRLVAVVAPEPTSST